MKALELSSTMPVVNGNFEEVKTELQNQLKQFDLIVDENSVKTAKSMTSQINKLSKDIDTLRKNEVSKLSAPIEEFNTKMKELTSLCQTSRQKLLSQVKVFDDKQKEKCLDLVTKYKSEIETKLGIKEGFEIEIPFDLAIVSNLTKTGLAKKARDAIEDRVLQAKKRQEKIDTRLMTLEGECYKAGLQAPLTKENISYFLMEPSDETYNSKLQSLIANEISRIQKMQERAAKKDIPKPVMPPIPPKPIKDQEQKTSNTRQFKNAKLFGNKKPKIKVKVGAFFDVEIDEKLLDKLELMLQTKFKTGGFKQIPQIEIYSAEDGKVVNY